MMRDETNFENAINFNAWRSRDAAIDHKSQDENNSSMPIQKLGLTDSSDAWLVWGAGRILCPGRFYATVVLKLVVVHMLTEYDVLFPDCKKSRSMQWRSAIIPKSSITLLVKQRIKL
jgi:cytochrome P450